MISATKLEFIRSDYLRIYKESIPTRCGSTLWVIDTKHHKCHDSWLMTNVMHKFFSMYLFLFITLYTFQAHRAHHQERQIVSVQSLVTVTLCEWPCPVQVGNYNSLHVSSTSCSSSGEKICVNTISGSCHSVPCAGWLISNLHTTPPPT